MLSIQWNAFAAKATELATSIVALVAYSITPLTLQDFTEITGHEEKNMFWKAVKASGLMREIQGHGWDLLSRLD